MELRRDPRLRARPDGSDVVPEVFLDVVRALDACLADPRLSPQLWSRLNVGRWLTTLHGQHLGKKMRGAGPEISHDQGSLPEASPAALASIILGRHASPTQAAGHAERMSSVPEARNGLDPIDREVLALRHLEQFSRAEAAELLDASQEAGAERSFRVLKPLKDELATLPYGREGL